MDDSLTVAHSERRKTLRLDMEQEIVSIHWYDQDSRERSQRVACIDICKGGLAVNSDIAFPVESTIEIKIKPSDSQSPKRLARIIRCREQESGCYQIGLIFIE